MHTPPPVLSHHPVQKRIFLSTLKNIQSMLNDRPLCPALDGAEQVVITPAHFLHANLGTYSLDKLLEHSLDTATAKVLMRFIIQDKQYLTKLWPAWKKSYLTHLRDKIPQSLLSAYHTTQ